MTVHRWLSEDAVFVATLNQAKREAIDAIRPEVRDGAVEAIKVVRAIMANLSAASPIRLRAALALLDSVGALDPEPIGPTEPEEIEAEIQRREMSRVISGLRSGVLRS
jgi:hypothetical protein